MTEAARERAPDATDPQGQPAADAAKVTPPTWGAYEPGDLQLQKVIHV